MRVVVVGATGNVGLQTVTALADDGVEVVGLARRRPDLALQGVTWQEADVASDDLVPLLRGADVVVHLAWLLQPSRDEAVQWRTNVEGTRRVLGAVAEAGVPAVIVFSSVGAYSPGPKDTPVDESWATDGVPTSPYSRQKAYNERVMDAFEARHPDIRVVRLRPGLLFQAAAASEIRRLFAGPFLPTPLLRRVGVPVVPDVPGLRLQLLHTSDVAEAVRLAVHLEVRGALNLAADPALDPPDIARVLGARLIAVSPRVLRAATAVGWWLRLLPIDPGWIDMALSAPLLSTERAHRELGWRPRLGAEEVLADFVRALGEQQGAPTPPLARDAAARLAAARSPPALAAKRVSEPTTGHSPAVPNKESAAMSDTADYSKHTDDELRAGIARVQEQEGRIAAEDSDAALDAAREQRDAMQAELDRRQA